MSAGARDLPEGSVMKLAASSALALVTVLFASSASANSFVEFRDDGTLAGKLTSPIAPQNKVLAGYKASGAPIPDFISVWTDFPMDQNDFETLFLIGGNDVTGIGLEQAYGGDGTRKFSTPGLRSILLHNDVMALGKRAALQSSSVDGFGQYLFLLELSHNWGPDLKVPASADGGGPGPGELIGFDFHWSFFLDPGGPAGGNLWNDDGDGGSFTVSGQTAKGVKYSMLDLYMMGLASKEEVPPFGVLENVVVPPTPTDPFFQGPMSAQSFPWFGSTPYTVQATKRTITIDDVIAANGPRTPDVSTSPKSWTLGVVLLLGQNDTDEQVAAAEAALEPVAASLPQAFHDATSGRGTLTLVTQSAVGSDAGPMSDGDAGTTTNDAASGDGSGGCNDGGAPASGWTAALGALAALGVIFGLRRRHARS